jgi:L-rhamnose isomerase
MIDFDDFDRSISREALKAINQISFAVIRAQISEKLPNNDTTSYINLQTLENEIFCIELTNSSYTVVSHEFDTVNSDVVSSSKCLDTFMCFETIDALMHKISPLYTKRFNEELARKLNLIEND